MSKSKAKVVKDDTPPDNGPQNPDELLTKREQIVKKARANRKNLTDEVNVDDDSMAVLDAANQDIIRGHRSVEGEEDEAPEKEAKSEPDKKEQRKDTKGVADPQVDVVVYGRTYKVPQSDIDRAGGTEAYQKSRAASIRMSEASATLQRAQRRQAEIERRERELEEREKRLQERTSRSTGSEDPEPPAQGAREDQDGEHKAKVKQIVNRIFSGNEEEAASAIEEILASSQGQQASPEAVAKMVVEQLKSEQGQQQETTRQESQPEVDPYYEQERREVNQIMSSEYRDILGDDRRKAYAKFRFNELRNDPDNHGRSLADMARQAGEEARNVGVEDPETQRLVRQEQKREMPSESAARSRAAPEGKPKPPPASEHIRRLRKGAGLSVN